MRNLVTILPLKSKLSGKFQRFNVTDGSIEMLKKAEFPKASIRRKNCKTFYEAQTASCSKEIFQAPPNPLSTRLNLATSLEQKFSDRYIQKYTDICFQSASRMQFLGVQKWRSANVFSKTKQKYVCWKSQKGFCQCCQSILFSMSSENLNVEVRETSEVFRVKLFVK